jgi:hypothetical protein
VLIYGYRIVIGEIGHGRGLIPVFPAARTLVRRLALSMTARRAFCFVLLIQQGATPAGTPTSIGTSMARSEVWVTCETNLESLHSTAGPSNFLDGPVPQNRKDIRDCQRTTMLDENLARLRARNNIRSYRRLLDTG